MKTADITIYHNPRCSKSRETLQIIEAAGQAPEVVCYLDTPPDAAGLSDLLKKLQLSARELLRKGEQEYRDLGLADESLTDAQLIDAMIKHPILIERPIVVCGDRAVLGRPPENVHQLLT
jgi:arsenate reductase